ncbi:MAG: hypothetical protein P1U74_03395 [Legionellaceae bacterium]|nr:hypothetical protein [Legionellaceae bacterium]
MKILYVCLLLALSSITYAEINTQYPGCTPDGSTAEEVLYRPTYYYIPQTPLSKEALEARAAEKEQ